MFEIVISINFILLLLFVFIYAIRKIHLIEKDMDSYYALEEEQVYLLSFLGEEKYAEYQEWKRENKIE